jgi:Rod binding domain-containing protein
MNISPIAIPTIAAAASLNPAASHSKLHDAAQQFEALIVGQMLRSEREAGWLAGEEDSAGESAMDIAEDQFSKALAASGGLGLANMIERTVGQPQSATRPELQAMSSPE